MIATKTKSYAVFYQDGEMFRRTSGVFDAAEDGTTMALPTSEFRAHYRYVGTHQTSGLEDLFALLNDAKEHEGIPNPLGDPRLQELVIRQVGHTSMSKGDVAVDLETGKLWFCASIGFIELELV